MFPKPKYTTFFTDFYSDAHFPECLLRPPAGWQPSSPAPVPPALEGDAMRRVQAVYRALYSETGVSYQELYNALRRGLPPPGDIRLIGSHGAEPAELDGLVFETVRSIVEHWPQAPDLIRALVGRPAAPGKRVCPVRKPQHPAGADSESGRIKGFGAHQIPECRDRSGRDAHSIGRPARGGAAGVGHASIELKWLTGPDSASEMRVFESEIAKGSGASQVRS